ncbi:MAG: hypothetical protein NXI20_19300 [bacterium]|nr:hypothetical protein [bacterium]
MKVLPIVILLVSFQVNCQTPERVQSNQAKQNAWDLFFEEQYDESKIKFQECLSSDSSNLICNLGLYYIEMVQGDKDDFSFLSKAANGNKELIWKYINLSLSLETYLSQPKGHRVDFGEFRFAEFKAFHMDGRFDVYDKEGQLTQSGYYHDQQPLGKWEFYRPNGKLKKTIEYSENTNMVLFKYFKDDGILVKDEYREGTGKQEKLVKTIIYWQEIPGKYGEYLPVSDSGFCVYDVNKKIVLDSSTPDNIIEEKFDSEKGTVWFIWKNGKREPYEGCYVDGTKVTRFQGKSAGVYVWEDCKEVFVRPLNEQEEKAKMAIPEN